MNDVAHDCSTEDEGIDEDMMFEFEEELDARLSLQDERPPNPMAALLQRDALAPDDKPMSFDFNGRRKRKSSDDSCCATPRVRPLAKRAKSFSSVDSVLLPDRGFKSLCAAEDDDDEKKKSDSTRVSLFATSRSSSIEIPTRLGASATLQRSSSGPARGAAKAAEAPAASSDPLARRAASSWNASVEYFCRRSLDISSPLRIRFRDLVVSSVGRAGSLKSP